MQYHYNPNTHNNSRQHTSPSQAAASSRQQPDTAQTHSGNPSHGSAPRQSTNSKSSSLPPRNSVNTVQYQHITNPQRFANQHSASSAPHSRQPQATSGQQNRPMRTTNAPIQNNTRRHLRPPAHNDVKQKQTQKKPINIKSFSGLLQNFLPSSVYNPKSKKLFGIFSAEDLLLVALIFLCAESEDDDNTLMIIALIYILASEYIDLPDLSL
ncbi:MAG: hypothetical protein IKW64_07785 [Clostridia bacterium]|nr:hypothetical protein [Clostridia bacterium]